MIGFLKGGPNCDNTFQAINTGNLIFLLIAPNIAGATYTGTVCQTVFASAHTNPVLTTPRRPGSIDDW